MMTRSRVGPWKLVHKRENIAGVQLLRDQGGAVISVDADVLLDEGKLEMGREM